MVHQCLDAFELRFLAWPTPIIDLTTLKASVVSLRANVDSILDMWVPESEATPMDLAEDTVLSALF